MEGRKGGGAYRQESSDENFDTCSGFRCNARCEMRDARQDSMQCRERRRRMHSGLRERLHEATRRGDPGFNEPECISAQQRCACSSRTLLCYAFRDKDGLMSDPCFISRPRSPPPPALQWRISTEPLRCKGGMYVRVCRPVMRLRHLYWRFLGLHLAG